MVHHTEQARLDSNWEDKNRYMVVKQILRGLNRFFAVYFLWNILVVPQKIDKDVFWSSRTRILNFPQIFPASQRRTSMVRQQNNTKKQATNPRWLVTCWSIPKRREGSARKDSSVRNLIFRHPLVTTLSAFPFHDYAGPNSQL